VLSAAGSRLSSGGSALNSNVLLPTGTGPTCETRRQRSRTAGPDVRRFDRGTHHDRVELLVKFVASRATDIGQSPLEVYVSQPG